MSTPAELNDLLEDADRRPAWRRAVPWALAALLLAAPLAWWAWRPSSDGGGATRYVTTPVARGTLAVHVTATGTLQPTRSVAVGSELSGTVARVHVDVNDRVRLGQVLVELDTAKLRDAVAAARAELAAAEARLRQSLATARESRAQRARLEELARVSDGKLPSALELDSARAGADRAAADVAAAEASVAQSRAALSTNATSLAKASIRSPIDGIVLARNVEPGNAVAASLQAVTLFTLAEDLRTMKLLVNVDEADVAQLRDGLRARFTVAAHPGREYPAVVTRVAYGSTTTDNVVTYTTQLDVRNDDLTLRPGMTATATIAAVERPDVLLVPNSALRFVPAATASGSGGSLVSRLMPRPPGRQGARRGGAEPRGNEGTVYVLRDGQPVALKVVRGLSDGRQTEISGEGVAAGLAVITDQTGTPK